MNTGNPAARLRPLTLLAAFAAACAADGAIDKAETLSAPDEVRLGGAFQDLGAIRYGESRTARYANPPRYRAYRFTAAAGDRVDVWVRSPRGDAMAWLTDASRNVLAQNDDAAPGTLDAHVTATVARAGEYRIFFRDYHLQTQTFTVSLARPADLFACATDRDCVSVSRGGCCTAWQRVAVNASRAEDYARANQCLPPYPPCAPPPEELVEAQNALVPVCNTARRQCELVEPGCTYNGRTYRPGETYSDGCNTCTCGPEGVAACTRRACLCNPATEPQRRYLGTPEVCMRIRYACNEGEQQFHNECGCGCEPAPR